MARVQYRNIGIVITISYPFIIGKYPTEPVLKTLLLLMGETLRTNQSSVP